MTFINILVFSCKLVKNKYYNLPQTAMILNDLMIHHLYLHRKSYFLQSTNVYGILNL